MKVCLVSQQYPPESASGGIGTQTWNKGRTLTRMGHTVHVLSSGVQESREPTTTTDDGVTVHRMPACGAAVYSTPAYWLGYSWQVFRHLRQLTKAVSFDLIDFADYAAEGFIYQLDRTQYDWIPIVVQLHGPLALFAERIGWPAKDTDLFRYGTMMEAATIRKADALMACSANIAKFTAGFYDVPSEKIAVVHCGVDAEAFCPAAPHERKAHRPTVLFVGNIAHSKGVHSVLKAVLQLRREYPEIRLQIAGKSDGKVVETLTSQAREEGAAANIEFLGFVGREQVAELYRQADVFCSPAEHEGGVANVYIEAMACGCPVVASTTGAAPEAVTDGSTGLLVPPNDVEATATAVARILGDPILQRSMGEAGRKRVVDYFAMDKYILRVLAVYETTIRKSGLASTSCNGNKA